MKPSRLSFIALAAALVLTLTSPGVSGAVGQSHWSHQRPHTATADLCDSAASTAPRIVFPAHGYNEYDAAGVAQVSAMAPTVGIVDADIANGPGTAYNSYFGAAIAAWQAAGLCVIGQVETGHGADSLSSVEAQISEWISWYNVDGAWLDEGSTDPAETSYYQTLQTYIHAAITNGIDLCNPGSWPPQSMIAACDITVTSEQTYSAFVAQTAPSWAASQNPATMGMLTYCTPYDPAALAKALKLAVTNHQGWLYVTDLCGGVYSALPGIWNDLNSAVMGEAM